jgi:hypothetical protein
MFLICSRMSLCYDVQGDEVIGSICVRDELLIQLVFIGI